MAFTNGKSDQNNKMVSPKMQTSIVKGWKVIDFSNDVWKYKVFERPRISCSNKGYKDQFWHDNGIWQFV